MSIQARKQALRQSIIAARLKMPGADRAARSRAITARLGELEAYRNAATVLAYMSFGAEFDTTGWVQQALRDGKQLLLPRVNGATRQLDIYQVKDLQHDIAPGKWDIPEPVPERCRLVEDLGEVDFILLPGVAFTRDGARLGYGGGFYDKLLARMTHRPALVAAAFDVQLADLLPQEPTDRKIEWLLTEHASLQCAA
ncbi:MAG TPA: 5-formyltetrahydrofolate cyclo-ligase [Gallionellaceae bacterium]